MSDVRVNHNHNCSCLSFVFIQRFSTGVEFIHISYSDNLNDLIIWVCRSTSDLGFCHDMDRWKGRLYKQLLLFLSLYNVLLLTTWPWWSDSYVTVHSDYSYVNISIWLIKQILKKRERSYIAVIVRLWLVSHGYI